MAPYINVLLCTVQYGVPFVLCGSVVAQRFQPTPRVCVTAPADAVPAVDIARLNAVPPGCDAGLWQYEHIR